MATDPSPLAGDPRQFTMTEPRPFMGGWWVKVGVRAAILEARARRQGAGLPAAPIDDQEPISKPLWRRLLRRCT